MHPGNPMGIPSAITPIGQLRQSPPSSIPGDLGRGPSHHSHVLERRDTYGQAEVCFVLTLFIFKAPNYMLAGTLTDRVV